VDVVLVLLIIFMLTAPIIQSDQINVPKTRTVKELTQERLVVSINRAKNSCG
jgi:biopolymer transport protein ExbD/biopolymer transport protein TolR